MKKKDIIAKVELIGGEVDNLRDMSLRDLDEEVKRLSNLFDDFLSELESDTDEEDAESTDKVE